MSSFGSLTYGVAKELTKILKPLAGKSPHHINSTHVFVEQVEQFALAPGKCLRSYAVSALFTSVPVDPAQGVIKDLLEKDPIPNDRTVLPVKNIILLLEFCLKNMYFSFQDMFYEQIKGVAIGSPVRPIVANLYMEYFEQKKNYQYSLQPQLWQRYVDDTFVIQKEVYKQDFLQHINSFAPAIQFTVGTNKEDGSIPFLDTIVIPEADGNLSITVYRIPTHMDQYLQWDSHHHLSAKFSVISTLAHMAKTVCSNPELLHKEMDHLRKALMQCKYPKWAFDKVEKRLNRPSREVTDGANNQGTTGAQPTTNEVKTKGHEIQTYFKGGSAIKNLLVSPKDKEPMVSKSGAIYWFQCGDLTYDDEYIGETSRTFGERFKEHLKVPSPIHHHSSHTGYPTRKNNFQIIGKGHGLARNIKESIFIKVNNPTLNTNIGKFNLPHIWDRVLLNTPGLTLKRHALSVEHANPNTPIQSTQLPPKN